MTIQSTIVCTTTVEPFRSATGHILLHVSLHLGMSGDGDQAQARTRHQAFLTAAGAARFRAYVISDLAAGVRLDALRAADGTVRELIPYSVGTSGLGAQVFSWLEARDAKWLTTIDAQDLAEVADHQVTAAETIASAKGWDAPIAGRAGLSRLFELDESILPAPGNRILLLPLLANDAAPAARYDGVNSAPPGDPDVRELRFACSLGGDFQDAEIVVRFEPSPPPDPTGMVEANGFVRMLGQADDPIPLIRRVRSLAGATLATGSQLIGLDWGAESVDWPRQRSRLQWRCLNGLFTLLDPIVTGLTMAETPREGPFTALINAALDDLRRGDGDASQIPAQRDATAWVTAAIVRDLITPASEADRTKLVARLFGLGEELTQALAAPIDGPGYQLGELPSLTAAILAAHILGAVSGARFDPSRRNPTWSDDLEQQLDRELGSFAQRLETERGTEDLVQTLFAELGLTDESLAQHLGIPGPFAKSPLAAFRAALTESINGAEAARQAYGQMVEHFITLYLRNRPVADKRWIRADLIAALAAADWFAVRLRVKPLGHGALDGFVVKLPIAGQAILDPADIATLVGPAGWFTERYAEALAELTETASPARRRTPDSVPQPLVIQVALDHDITDADRFADRYQGVAVLLQREADPWTYANLAVPTLTHAMAGGAALPITVHPIRPAAVDGQRKLAIDYQGIPLASTDFKASGSTPNQEFLPFYTFTDPSSAELQAANYARLPALAYGTRYTVAAHVVSISGALPPAIADPAAPWVPVPQPALPAPPPGVSHTRPEICSRTTAIGQVGLLGAASGATRALFDSKVEGVQPLFRDYPRDGQVTAAGGKAGLDLWRAHTGEGLLAAPGPDRETRGEITDIWGWGGKGRIHFELFQSPRANPGDQPLAAWSFPVAGPFAGGSVTFEASTTEARLVSKGVAGWPELAAVPIALGHEPLWLRVRLDADPGAILGISFARISEEAGGDSQTSGQGFLLLAPNQTEWRGVPTEAHAVVKFPRMAFLDFDRWLSNPALAQAADDGDPQALLELHKRLIGAFASEDLDDQTALGLSQLPDLAVGKLLVELVPLDDVKDAPSVATASPLRDVSLVLDLPPIGRIARALCDPAGPIGDCNMAVILDKVSETYSMDVVIREGDSLGLAHDGVRTLTVNVPAGRVARLAVRPLVDATLFMGVAPVISSDLAAWAADRRDGSYLFDGAQLTIETMCNLAKADWNELAARRIAIAPAGSQRQYDLVAGTASAAPFLPEDWAWRQIGAIRVDTQRWRFLGRPIHHWFHPERCQFAGGGAPPALGCPAVRLVSDSDPRFADVKAFESEAFLERSEDDVDQHSTLLRPLPSPTVVQMFAWEQPSATMFRHRLVLRSRYAGALRNSGNGSKSVHDEDAALGTWIRVAMLADLARLELTRPQLRALVPLTSSPGESGAPPIMAFLAEHPFAHGGLADRIGAEVKTGFSFSTAGKRLKVKDSRKEFGPDPRLTYVATPADQASGVTLSVEGPIGLSFDSEGVTAPAFANTALVLAPAYLKRADAAAPPEEHFVSVSLRRYLDRQWTVATEADAARDTVQATQSWWIELADAPSTEIKCGNTLIARIVHEGDEWSAAVTSAAVLPDSPDADDPVVARAAWNEGSRIALLHQPLDEGRGALSIFLLQDRVDDKPGRTPLMLASYEWSLPSGVSADGTRGPKPIAEKLTFSRPAHAYAVRASTATAMNWTRTGANTTVLHLAKPGDAVLEPASVNGVRLVRKDKQFVLKKDGSPRWLRSKLSASPFPLHVHRHMAILLTGAAPGNGPAAEAFLGAFLAPALALPIDATAGAMSMRAVEFEVPAQPIGSGLPNPQSPSAQHFSRAVFDLVATRAGFGAADAGLMLWLRPLGAFRTMAAQSSIGLRLTWQRLNDAQATDPPAVLDLTVAKALDLVQVLFWLRTGKLLAAAVDLHGSLVPIEANMTWAEGERQGEAAELPPLKDLETLSFGNLSRSINGIPDTGELWADISIMTVPQPPAPPSPAESALTAVPLPLHRFFSDDGLPEPATIAEAVGPEALRRQPEVEARIVAVSPRIALRGST